jgi:superfamily II DNA/RNA helicase
MHVTKTFRDLGVDPALTDALETKGITHPFPIQELTLPLALKGHDLIGQARTGTGKTLAFGLPLLQRVDPDAGHTQALVIVPTRELCLQVYEDLSIGSARGLTSISVYGGVGYEDQTEALQGGAHVVVGTPGRLLDLLNRRVLDLSKVTQLVLDEADEMLDMGFLPDVERLIEACQGDDRHTMLFSATMPTAIVKLARRYMDHPTFTRADHEQKETAPNVTQHFFQVHRMDKPRLLARILQDENRGGVYVFVRTKHMADRLVNDLEELRIPAIAIHGDLRQQTREKNLDRFRSGKATVLVCTEVAARGLDVSGVTHVVNYDCPDDEKMYLHRIGRTARAGEAGVAITFAEFNEVDRLNVIRKKVEATDAEVLQVFSTSKVLRELFTLPDETPWDHLTKGSGRRDRDDAGDRGGRGGSGGSGKGGGRRGGRSDARDDDRPRSRDQRGRDDGDGDSDTRDGGGPRRSRDTATDEAGDGGRGDTREDGRSRGRPARTDGRPKSGRASEGRGGKHDAERPRERDARARDERDGGRGRSADRGPRDEGDDTSSRSRTRTRTRTRADAGGGREGGGGEGRTRARGTRDDERGDGRGSGGRGDGRGSSGRGDGRGSGGREGRARQDGDTKRQRGGDDGGRQRERGEQRDRDDRGGSNRGGAKRGGSGRKGSNRGSGERDSGGGGRQRAGNRGGGQRGRGRDDQGGGGQRSSRGDRDTSAVPVARRGEEARGEGEPQLARRVTVEHLP